MVEFIEIKKGKLNNFAVEDENVKKIFENIKNKNFDEKNLQKFLNILEEFAGKIYLTIDYTIQISKYTAKEYLVNYYNNVKND